MPLQGLLNMRKINITGNQSKKARDELAAILRANCGRAIAPLEPGHLQKAAAMAEAFFPVLLNVRDMQGLRLLVRTRSYINYTVYDTSQTEELTATLIRGVHDWFFIKASFKPCKYACSRGVFWSWDNPKQFRDELAKMHENIWKAL